MEMVALGFMVRSLVPVTEDMRFSVDRKMRVWSTSGRLRQRLVGRLFVVVGRTVPL